MEAAEIAMVQASVWLALAAPPRAAFETVARMTDQESAVMLLRQLRDDVSTTAEAFLQLGQDIDAEIRSIRSFLKGRSG